MKSAERKTRKRKSNGNQIHVRPKRPTSAYDFFFRELRDKLKPGSSQQKDNDESEKKLNVEEIGRLIGQRWQGLSKNELAEYEDMAKKDYARYEEEMAVFHDEELALMCMGHNAKGNADSQDDADDGQESHQDEERQPSGNKDLIKTLHLDFIQADEAIDPKVVVPPHPDDDRKPAAKGHYLREAQQQISNFVTALPLLEQEEGKVRTFPAMPFTAADPQLDALGVAPVSDQNAQWILQHVQQLVQSHQEQGNSIIAPVTDERIVASLSNQICQQRAAIKNRQDAILLEYKLLQTKDDMLEKMISSLLEKSNISSLSQLTKSSTRNTLASEADANLLQILVNMNCGISQSDTMNANTLPALMPSNHPSSATAPTHPMGNRSGQFHRNQYLQLPQIQFFGTIDVQAILAQAASSNSATSASLANLHQIANQSHPSASTEDNMWLISQVLASQQHTTPPTEAAKKKSKDWE